MINNHELIYKIKDRVKGIEPNATIILYGSYTRGENKRDSDIF